jgi:hypothetical protein
MRAVKIFFGKILFLTVVAIGGTAWFVTSDTLNDYPQARSLKSDIRHSVGDYATTTQNDIEKYTTTKKNELVQTVFEKLGYESPKVNPPIVVTPQVNKNTHIVKGQHKPVQDLPIPNAPTDIATNTSENPPTVNTVSDFAHFSIPFYYDHSNAPNNFSKEQVLGVLQQVSQTWTQACNVSFDYRGDKLTDYVDGNNTIGNHEGLVKWGNLPGNAVGRAHQGDGRSYARGFVLVLKPSYFLHNEKFLYSTILHETGHVIGLPHSNNGSSIMFWQQSQRKQILNDTDKTMCKYFRTRWQGMSSQHAAQKYGLLVNESSGNQTDSNEENDE